MPSSVSLPRFRPRPAVPAAVLLLLVALLSVLTSGALPGTPVASARADGPGWVSCLTRNTWRF